MKKSRPWRYGDDAPKSWHETAEILKQHKTPVKSEKKKKSSGLLDRMDEIERLIKEMEKK